MTTQTPISEEELRHKVNKLLDFFTEPGQGEKYLRDLENDLMQLIKQYGNQCRVDELLGLADKKETFVGYGYDSLGVDVNIIDERISELTQTNEEES